MKVRESAPVREVKGGCNVLDYADDAVERVHGLGQCSHEGNEIRDPRSSAMPGLGCADVEYDSGGCLLTEPIWRVFFNTN